MMATSGNWWQIDVAQGTPHRSSRGISVILNALPNPADSSNLLSKVCRLTRRGSPLLAQLDQKVASGKLVWTPETILLEIEQGSTVQHMTLLIASM